MPFLKHKSRQSLVPYKAKKQLKTLHQRLLQDIRTKPYVFLTHLLPTLAATTQHIPDKRFQLVLYYDWYSKMRGQRNKQAESREPVMDYDLCAKARPSRQ